MITITTATGLQNMKNDLTEDYVLGNNINCSGIGNFEPVGGWNGQPAFTGTFDGKGYKISNLTIDRAADSYIGLFGETDGANIKNVTLEDFTLTGDWNIGALVGHSLDAPISNITVINVTIVGEKWVGGMVGQAEGATVQTITNCNSTGSVTSTLNMYVGGLFGYIASYEITDCHSSVAVSGTDYVGGFAGMQRHDTIALRCYATGTVDGSSWYVGGFVGGLGPTGIIDRCYASGDVTSVDSSVGGFVGDQSGGIINDCYATGDVEGDDWVGGFAGMNADANRCYSTGAITHGVGATRVGGFTGYNYETLADCFWDTTTSGEATGAGGGTPQTGLTGKTTAQMKTLNTILDAGWSIPAIWNITSGCNNGYPCLVGVNACCSDSAVPPVDPTIAPKCVSLELIRNLEMMNNSRGYISKDGKFVYESRYHR